VYGDTIKLRYTKTKTLLGIDIGRAPRLEPSAKRVVMHSEDGAPVRFRVMPRFMSLAEGNTVCYGDSIQAPRPPRPAPHRAPTAPPPPRHPRQTTSRAHAAAAAARAQLISVDYPSESLHASTGFMTTGIGVVHEVRVRQWRR